MCRDFRWIELKLSVDLHEPRDEWRTCNGIVQGHVQPSSNGKLRPVIAVLQEFQESV